MTASDILRELANNPSALRDLAVMLNDAGGIDTGEYSSLKLPPDCPSRKRFREVAKTITGSRKVGQVWFVDRSAWVARRTVTALRDAVPSRSYKEIANTALKRAGYRGTK